VDKIVPSLGGPRLCPECSRLLSFWEGKYLCTYCWILYKLEETLEHPYKEMFCIFGVQEAEAVIHYTCYKCSKSFMVSREDVEANRLEKDIRFSEENVARERAKKLKKDGEIHEEVMTLLERDRQIKEAFKLVMEAKGEVHLEVQESN